MTLFNCFDCFMIHPDAEKIASMSDKEVRGGRRERMEREELVPKRMEVKILEVWEYSYRQRRLAAAAVLGLWRCLHWKLHCYRRRQQKLKKSQFTIKATFCSSPKCVLGHPQDVRQPMDRCADIV